MDGLRRPRIGVEHEGVMDGLGRISIGVVGRGWTAKGDSVL